MINSNDASVNKDLATARTPLVEQGPAARNAQRRVGPLSGRQRNKRRRIDGS
jgi:hypothetical protein